MRLTTAQKISFLNNMETMYTEGLAYIDAITHATSYYTEAQADAKYLPKGTKTANSVAMTLDGYTAQQIQDAGTPGGVIGIWSGSEASIPSGWHLCDGSSGTPNLRDKFIVGAGSNYARAETGGANTVTSAATITVAGHALTAAEIPKHTHGSFTDNYATGASSLGGWDYDAATSSYYVDKNTGSTGSGSSHNHTATFAGTASQDKRPPYMARCYIMRV
jgi:hypothetical protein